MWGANRTLHESESPGDGGTGRTRFVSTALVMNDTRSLQAWLGHKNIQHTVRYTELAPDRFKNFWRD